MANRSMVEICAVIDPIAGLGLRTWRTSDVDALVAAWNDPEIAQWNPVPPVPSHEFADAWITGAAVQTSDDVGIDAVIERDGALVGEIGLQVNRERQLAEIGFWIGAEHRGQGLGSTMLELGVALGAQLELQGLVALVDPANERTIALLESARWPELPTQSNRRAFVHRF